MTTAEKVAELKAKNPDWGRNKIAHSLGITPNQAGYQLEKLHLCHGKQGNERRKRSPEELKAEAIKLLKKPNKGAESIAKQLAIDLPDAVKLLEEIRRTHAVESHGEFLTLAKPGFGRLELKNLTGGKAWRIGAVADTHLACKEERLDTLHALYDFYASEGITEVFHAGNIVDGYIQKINGASVFTSTPDGQAQYVIDNYPNRKGITTYFITGDDHEGWWIQTGFNWGNYLQMMAEDQGRKDLRYLGHVEADIEFRNKAGSVIMKVQHPGGGSAYARSYTGQKQVEAFQGGEKPAILLQGHYHVNNYMHDRNVHVVSLPGVQDQTIFARKKRLRMDVGGGLLEFHQSPNDGSVTRFKFEFLMFFDRGYYRPFLRSDSKISKGRLLMKAA